MNAASNRRHFLRTSAGAAGGLLLGFCLTERRRLVADTPVAAVKLNAYVQVGNDDIVTLYIHKAEMGQGTVTSLAMLLAEELECDWKQIRTEFPGIDSAYGVFQGVGGSQSIRSCYGSLREAGAVAREMLVQAAAQKWGVEKRTCRAEKGAVVNTEDPKDYKYIGKPMKRLDTPGNVDGSIIFGIDVRLPNMLYAVVQRCPAFGGRVVSFDDKKAKATPGVRKVVEIFSGVAVIADSTWTAMEGRRNLVVQLDESTVAAISTPDITQAFAKAVQTSEPVPGRPLMGIDRTLDVVPKKIDAVYQMPYLAHAAMEPLNCTAWVRSDAAEVWVSTQMQSAAREIAAQKSGLPREKVQVHSQYMGGGFGGRVGVNYIGEAVEVAKSVDVPVKLTWSREDDMQHDTYRPASYCRCIGGLDADGWPVVWKATIACPTFGNSDTQYDGFRDIAYKLEWSDTRASIVYTYLHHNVDLGIPVGCWRSAGYSQNTFFIESFLDEMAYAGGKDPMEVRRRLIGNNSRLRDVLELAANRADWGKPLQPGRGRGVSLVNNIGSNTVQIAEASVENGKLKVHRVVCVVDCGAVVNPAGVVQQIESGIAFGLSALKSGITIKNGRVEQGNFHEYDVVRIDEMPKVEVHIMPGGGEPGGIV
jgi:isoquinoline 1-oxidoreductase beta subunit